MSEEAETLTPEATLEEAPKTRRRKVAPTEEPQVEETAEVPKVTQVTEVPKVKQVKVKVLRNLFYDGQRFRAAGEVITLPEDVIPGLPADTVERI